MASMAQASTTEASQWSGDSRRSIKSKLSSPAELRFSDVAQYVGFSLKRDPNASRPPAKAASHALLRPNPAHMKDDVFVEMPKDEDLPQIANAVGRPDRIRCQMEWLKAEQRAEREQLKKLEISLSDSLLLEQKAHRRSKKQQDMRDFHNRRAQDVDQMINRLKEELALQEMACRKPEKDDARRSWAGSGPDANERPVTGALMNKSSSASARSTPNLQAGRGLHLQQKSETGLDSSDGHVGDYRQRGSLASAGKTAVAAHFPASGAVSLTVAGPAAGFGGSSGSRQSPARAPAGGEPANSDDDGNEITLKDYFDAAEAADRSEDKPDKAEASQRYSPMGTRPKGSPNRSLELAPVPPTKEELAEMLEQQKKVMRREIAMKCGGTKEAFRKLDTNGNGAVSLGEFADGVMSLGVDWQAITGLRRPRELFKAFDTNKDGIITYEELFPDAEEEVEKRVSTPEFWKQWCRKNKDIDQPLRGPKWQPANAEEELEVLFLGAKSHEEGTQVRKWMSATIRRLKNRGKSDARCREVVAHHLPRGTGPKDREDVQTFSKSEVKACRKAYLDEVNNPVKNIQKVVYDMREQRRTLHEFRQKLWAATVQPVLLKQMEEDRKNLAAGLAVGLGFAAGGPATKVPKNMSELAVKCAISEEELEELFKTFALFAEENSEDLSAVGFGKLIKAMCSTRPPVDAEVDVWWDQICGPESQQAQQLARAKATAAELSGLYAASAGDAATSQKALAEAKKLCNFDQFAEWYGASEAQAR